MPRMGRSVLPDYPHHIIQRGHNRQVVFSEAVDFERYLETLRDFKDIYGVRVYARVRVGSDTVLFDQTQAACIVGSNGRPDFNTPKMICTSLRIAAPTIAILGLPA